MMMAALLQKISFVLKDDKISRQDKLETLSGLKESCLDELDRDFSQNGQPPNKKLRKDTATHRPRPVAKRPRICDASQTQFPSCEKERAGVLLTVM